MSNASPKTTPNDRNVHDFLDELTDEKQRQDSLRLLNIFQDVTGHPPKMWGNSIIGFDVYHYKYASGREGDAPAIAFSPRKGTLTLYISYGIEKHKDLLAKLGPHKTSKACLYIKRLEDIDMAVLKKILAITYKEVIDNKHV